MGASLGQESQRGETDTDQKELDSEQGGEKGTSEHRPPWEGQGQRGVRRATSRVEGTASRLGGSGAQDRRGRGKQAAQAALSDTAEGLTRRDRGR